MSTKKTTAGRRKAAETPGALTEASRGKQPGVIVGVGSSAGGLQPLKDLIVGLDPAAGACLVMAQHIPPSHHSLLAELLAPKTALKVRYLNRPTRPAPNLVLVIPPNFDAIAEGGKIVPVKLAHDRIRGARPSIDRLFQTLATEYGDKAVGVILSGTGSDGTVGAQAIKAAGGVVLVQDPNSAQFDAMPRSVIQAQTYDAVMTPDQVGAALVRVVKAQSEVTGDAGELFAALPDRLIRQIKQVVRRRTGFNLDHYKASTVLRRLRRRSQLAGCDSIEDYLAFLSKEPDEAQRLAGDLSVRVTSFFRDPKNFEALRPLISDMVQQAVHGDVLRIWVPGCATGEEAYSLAILIAEEFRAIKSTPSFLMFVSDINPDAVNQARIGQYPEDSLERMPAELRSRYFEVRDGRAEVSKTLRQYLIFAAQNVVEDPPFSKLDLISCRNLLIYLEAASQQQVLAAFHYALKPKGVLFLGASESPDVQRDLFEVIDGRAHIYRRRVHPIVFQYQGHRRAETEQEPTTDQPTTTRSTPTSDRATLSRKQAIERTRDIVAEHYSPPAIIIDADDRIVHFVGDLSPFVTLPRGPTQWTAHQLVIAPLNAEMRALLHRARKERATVRGGNYTLDINGKICRVSLVAHPETKDKSGLVMLAFETRPVVEDENEKSAESVSLIRELERELANTREHLQTLVEEVETSNEELQTLNEELQSSNEELQSTNEEMQTANEELQSTNEELLTVNDELANKTLELETSRSDLENIKESLETAIVAVDEKLLVTQFNRAATRLVVAGSLRPGALLSALDWTIPAGGILTDVLEVMAGRSVPVRMLEEPGMRALRLSVNPCRPVGGGRATGAVLSFTDVEELVAAQQAQRRQERLYQLMLQSSQSGVVLVDLAGRIVECNPAMAQLLRVSREALVGSLLEAWLDDAGVGQFRSHMAALLAGAGGHSSLDVRLAGTESAPRWVSLELSTVPSAVGMPAQLVAHFHDIHERKRKQDRLARDNQRLQIISSLTRLMLESESEDSARASVVDGLGLIYEDLDVSYLSWSPGNGLVVRHLRESPDRAQEHPVSAVSDTKKTLAISVGLLRRLKAMQTEVRGVRSAQEGPVPAAVTKESAAEGFQFDAPVFNGPDLVGVLRLESPGTRLWSEDDTLLVKSVADLLSMVEREYMERYLRELAYRDLANQRERVTVTLESLGDGVITTDDQGRVEYMNPMARKLCGIHDADYAGKPLFAVYRPLRGDTAAPVPSLVEKAITEMQPAEDASLDLYLARADGQRIHINHSASPIRDSNGRCNGVVLVFRDVSHTRMLARELSHRAAHDSLTGLANREEFLRQAELALLEAQVGSGRHTVLAFDLDHFKQVNDTAGHAAGDELLREVAKRLRAPLRESDLLARVGGDEFLALLRNCGEQRATQLAEAIIRSISEMQFEWNGRQFSVGISVGVAMMSAESADLTAVLDIADQGCYLAKRAGRNCVRKADAPSADTGLVRLLRDAIDGERCLVLRQQAKGLRPGASVEYYELLMRVGEPGAAQGPDSFIAAARRHQMLPELERLSIRAAIRAVGARLPLAPEAIYSVNLFPEGIADLSLIEMLISELKANGIAPSQICLEIPEAAAIRNEFAATRFAQTARRAGFQIAMDQFGSQLNSFSLIRSLDLQFVKVNLRPQDLSSGRPTPVDRTVLEALCHICRQSGIRTIAVGVETEHSLQDIREIGVDYAQGMVVSPPEVFS